MSYIIFATISFLCTYRPTQKKKKKKNLYMPCTSSGVCLLPKREGTSSGVTLRTKSYELAVPCSCSMLDSPVLQEFVILGIC